MVEERRRSARNPRRVINAMLEMGRLGWKTTLCRQLTSNQPPQPQDPTHQRDRRIMWSARAWGQEAMNKIGEGGGEAKKHEKIRKS